MIQPESIFSILKINLTNGKGDGFLLH